jgi:hypothetical protein
LVSFIRKEDAMRQFVARRGVRVVLAAAGLGLPAVVGGAGGAAWGRVLTFDGLVPGGTYASYAERGYTLTPSDGVSIFVGYNFGPVTTAPYVYPSTNGRFTLGSARPFDVRSIDLGPLADSVGPRTVTFTGTLAAGGTVSQTFTTGGAFSLTPFAFGPAFTRLTSLEWDPSLTIADNVVVEHGPVMTFDGLAPGGSRPSHAENGFRVEATAPGAILTGNTLPGSAGETYAFLNHGLSRFRFADEGGRPFDLFGVELAPLNGNVGPQEVTFTGTLAGGGTVSQTFMTGAAEALTPFYFGGEFTGLVAVEWTPGSTLVDNIEAGLSVPEPGGAAAAAIAGLAALTRRRPAR